jgi:hypothetical protein
VLQSWNHPYYHTQRFVHFWFQLYRNDTHTSYLAGSKLQQTRRLNNIITYANDNSIRTYDLGYQYYGIPKKSQLTSIQECTNNGRDRYLDFCQTLDRVIRRR